MFSDMGIYFIEQFAVVVYIRHSAFCAIFTTNGTLVRTEQGNCSDQIKQGRELGSESLQSSVNSRASVKQGCSHADKLIFIFYMIF
jgi:hypothetical protein